MDIIIEQGWPTAESQHIARLYDFAFGDKFAGAIADKEKRIALLSKSFKPQFSFVAKHNNTIVGLAGFKTPQGALTGGINGAGIIQELGFWRGLRACAVFSLFERDTKPLELVMDGIVVDRNYQGKGIGTKLLNAIITFATQNGYHTVRLDVINKNARAKKLYEQKGFLACHEEHFPYLKWLIGFSGATTMVYQTDLYRAKALDNQ